MNFFSLMCFMQTPTEIICFIAKSKNIEIGFKIMQATTTLGPSVFPTGHSLTVCRKYLFRSEIHSEGKYQCLQGIEKENQNNFK